MASPVDGEDFLGVKFGNYNGGPGGTGAVVITGTVFNDLNANGVRDSGEGGVANAVISATNAARVFTTTADGAFTLFAPVTSGQAIIITETDPTGYVSTTPDVVTYTTATGGSALSADFGDFAGVRVQGVLFADRNADGRQQAAYEPVITATTTIAGSGGLSVQATGVYTLYATVVGGLVTVSETVPSGYSATTPTALTFAGTAGQTYTGKDFGVLPSDCGPDAFEALDDDLFTTTGVTLTANSPQSHTFHEFNDKDWARVDLQAGGTYTITATASGARADTLLTFFAADGVTMLAQSDNFSNDFSSQIVWQPEADGLFYVRVTQLNPILAGCEANYTLTMTYSRPTNFSLYLPIIQR